MSTEELIKHAADIKRQTIELYKTPGFFAGESRRERWRQCLNLVLRAWKQCGPQKYGPKGPVIILHPPSSAVACSAKEVAA